MKNKMKVKVIKKNSPESVSKTPLVAEKNQHQIAEKKMISTISDWVIEFQQNRLEDTRKSFEKLFTQPLSPCAD